ncbi:nitrate- and nitrite sensing domain-containing protein [Streptomycetaceae bacterium NBC_01309]
MRSPRRALTGLDRQRRRSSIRTLLVILAIVPSLALVGLWGFTAQYLWSKTSELKDQNNIATQAGLPAYTVMAQLQQERGLSAAWLAAPSDPVRTALQDVRAKTDAALGEFVGVLDGLADTDADVLDRAHAIQEDRDRLPGVRDAVDKRQGTRADLLAPYTAAVEKQMLTFAALSHIDADGHLTARAETLVDMFRATEMIAREDAVLTYAAVAGRLGADEFIEFAEAAGARRSLYAEEIRPSLEPEFQGPFQALTESPQWRLLVAVEDAVLGSAVRAPSAGAGIPLPAEAATWRANLDALTPQLTTLNTTRAGAIVQDSRERVDDLELTVWLITALGLLVVVVVSLLCWAVARSLRRRLLGLHAATVDVAKNRLPDAIERLSRGEDVDTAAELPELPHGRDEIGQVAEAFTAAQRAALEGAARLARERAGHAKVFHNVALRTQSLVGRQLRALDAMESRHQDPEVLEDLFMLDHLATRLRRYEENLVILSGHPPGRRWSKPVRVVDVVRSAVGEVEDYSRIDVHVASDLALSGAAVGPVIHLLAELLENAAQFSPPETPVEVRGMAVAKGLVVEIEDRGLGMGEDEYAVLNAELAAPRPFDMVALADDVRLGLFVVAQLAHRHGISVTLRPSPYGGTLAIVFLPRELIVGRPDEPAPENSEEQELPSAETTDASDVSDVSDVSETDGTPVPLPVPSHDAAEHVRETGRPREPAAPGGEPGMPGGTEPVAPVVPVAVVPRPAEAGRDAPAGADAPAGRTKALPRRVRQASLAAPLRAQPEPPANGDGDGTDAATRPTPQQAAATISAFQRASERARAAEHTSEPPKRDRP